MATNLAIDDSLLTLALRIGGQKTKKDTVTLALQEFIQRRKMEDVTNLFGEIDYEKGGLRTFVWVSHRARMTEAVIARRGGIESQSGISPCS